MGKQEATQLTDKIDKQYLNRIYLEAAEEIRRLRQVNFELVEGLEWIANVNAMDYEYQVKARAALARAKEKNT